MTEKDFAFDEIWQKLPHISAYQVRLLVLVGYVGIIGGFMAIYPVFAQFKPDIRCETIFDTDPDFNFLTFDEIKSLTTDTPACQGYDEGLGSYEITLLIKSLRKCFLTNTVDNQIVDSTGRRQC